MEACVQFDNVLGVRSERDLDVDALLTRHSGFEPDRVWRKGERRFERSPGICTSTGFSLSVAEGANWSEVWALTMERLPTLAAILSDARAAGAEVTLDVGVFPDLDAFTRTIRVPPADLAVLSSLGVELAVTSYSPSLDPEVGRW